jgi:hypothetical protein
MKQLVVTPSMGKRLIAKALASSHIIQDVLKNGTLVIVAGTTNGYIAEEILNSIGEKGFSRKHFFRGIIMPPTKNVTSEGRLADENEFPGDVVIVKGKWERGKTIMAVADSLGECDVILKGANALDLQRRQAAVLIGHPKAGTSTFILQATTGRRVGLILPVGLEKRVNGDLYSLSEKLNGPGSTGYRLLPIPGYVFTEIDAIKQLTGADAEIVAAGGVCGAEGSCLLAICGTKQQEKAAEELLASVADEPLFGNK